MGLCYKITDILDNHHIVKAEEKKLFDYFCIIYKKKEFIYSNMANNSVAFELKTDGSCYLRGSRLYSVIAITKFNIKGPE